MPRRIEQFLGHVKRLTHKGCSETRAFRNSSKHIFRVNKLRKYLNYQAGDFVPNVEHFI